MRRYLSVFTLIFFVFIADCKSQSRHIISVRGTGFELNSQPFHYTGISFFNAIYNHEFNKSSEVRKKYLNEFLNTGINVLRIWCQWENARGFIDSDETSTLYYKDGALKQATLSVLKSILSDADEKGVVVLLVLFSRESWNDNVRLTDEASEKAVGLLARELIPYRNLVFQIWNEFDYRTVEYYEIIKEIDSDRLVTNSPGYASVLGSVEENWKLDFLSPHTTRRDDRHWEVAQKEIEYLITKYSKPVVDDEPARKGTPKFGGPINPTLPQDHILHIYNVWKVGGHAIYHHDMFQTGYGTEAIPENGIPLPGFSRYHDDVFNFLKSKERYLNLIQSVD